MVHTALRATAAVAIVLGLPLTQAALAQQPEQPSAAPSQPAPESSSRNSRAHRLSNPGARSAPAPIALYPDELIARDPDCRDLPVEIVMAARWAADPKNAALKGDALVKALDGKPGDASVKSLAPFPSVLKMMSEKLEWTQAGRRLSEPRGGLPGGGAGAAPQSSSHRDAGNRRRSRSDRPAPGGPGGADAGAGPSGTTGRRADNRGAGDRGPDDHRSPLPIRRRSMYPPMTRRPPTGPGRTQLSADMRFLRRPGLRPRDRPGHRPRLWRWRRRSRLAVGLGQPQLEWRQRQHQQQPIQQHQSHGGQRQHLAAQCGAPPGCRLSRWGDASALWPRDGRRRRPPGLPRLRGAWRRRRGRARRSARGRGRAGRTTPCGDAPRRTGSDRGEPRRPRSARTRGWTGCPIAGSRTTRRPRLFATGWRRARQLRRAALGVQSRQWGSDPCFCPARCGKPPAIRGRLPRRWWWFPGWRPWWRWRISARRRWWRRVPRWRWRPWRRRRSWRGRSSWRRRRGPWQTMTFLRAGGARLCPVLR